MKTRLNTDFFRAKAAKVVKEIFLRSSSRSSRDRFSFVFHLWQSVAK